MTKEEIDNLKVGDVYLRIDDPNYPRTITDISLDPCLRKLVYFDNGITYNQWSYNTFEELRLNSNLYKLISKAKMTKNDLKEGMIIVCKNGKKYRLIGDRFIGECGWNSTSSFEDNLKCKRDNEYDIVQVHLPISYPASIKDLLNVGDCIWVRTPEKEMTIAEIETKLGLDPGTLRIKK